MKATIWMWLITMPDGEDRVVPLLGPGVLLLWDEESVATFRPMAEAWAATHAPGLPLRLAKLVEI